MGNERVMWFVAGWLLSAWLLERYGRRALGDQELEGASWEAIVVAGCGVLPDGRPSRALRRRTERAVELWKRGLAPVIVFTGGLGGDRPTEARAAAAHAKRLGVPREALVIEERSATTEENALFARDELSGGPIIVVSDTYHLFRCERVFAKRFARVRGAASSSPSRFVGALREVGAVALYGLTRRL